MSAPVGARSGWRRRRVRLGLLCVESGRAGIGLVMAGVSVETDAANFTQWAADLSSGQSEHRRIALLEVEARVRRLALAAPRQPAHRYTGSDPTLGQVVTMVRHIPEHFRDPLTVAEVAAAARLHPKYAMTQFRKTVRTTILEYLTRCRLAEGRRVLITTDLPIAAVAFESGFSSISRFYTAFKSGCGMPPVTYRRQHRSH